MMKREYGAAALLILLFFLSMWNIRRIDTLTTDVGIALSKSLSAAEKLDFKAARKHLDEGMELWLDADEYTHIFIRHSEIDAATDAFFELREVLCQEELSAFTSAFGKLRYHLESISTMEKPSLGSVL